MSTRTPNLPALAFVAGLSLCAAPLQAAQYCVETSSQLALALASAAQSPEDDDVRLRSGTFILSSDISLPVNGALILRGGWTLGCLLQSNNPESTRITSDTPWDHGFMLRPRDGDLRIERITFDRLSSFVLQDEGSASNVVGTISLLRNRFVRNQLGPLLRPRDKDLRVENNIIVETVQRSLQIQRASATAPISIDVYFNTILGGTEGARISGVPGVVRFRNNVLDEGASNGALVITGGMAGVTHNLVGTIDLEDGGSASPVGSNLLGIDPLLDADLIPLADSPVLHTGTNSVGGGLPATDYAGSPRKVGSHVDRGARESTLSNIDTLVVTSNANSGPGTLRQAILDANVTPNEESIAFDIGGDCPRFIALATPLPTISATLTIDGFTQPGSSPNSEDDHDNSVHCVVLFGDGARVLNLTPAADQEITVRGLAFYRSTDAAIRVSGAGRATIVGNTFNTGTSVFELDVPDYAISVDGASGTRIGSHEPANRNIIGRASVAGVRLGPGTGRYVEGNFIGITKSGSGDAGNDVGVLVIDAEFDSVGGNFIGNSVTDGLRVQGSQSVMNVQGNKIGVAPADEEYAPNGRNGIRLEGSSSVFMRVNRIEGNVDDGIAVLAAAQGADLGYNYITNNGQLGIDLSPNGVNPIDTDTGATGANNSQNFPELFTASGSEDAGTVVGQLRSSNGEYELSFYAGTCDSSGYGEGQRAVGGFVLQITNGSDIADGVGTFTANLTSNDEIDSLGGRAITAIASRKRGNFVRDSSEFSACIEYLSLEVFRDGFEP